MKKVLLLLSFLSLELFALSLDELITQALEKNPSLASIEHRITANQSAQDISKQFANPVLSFSADNLDKTQKMHKQTLTLQQKLPYYGKRDTLLEISKADEGILDSTLFDAQVKLVNEIKNQAYNIWELQELLKIIQEYENITRQNIELSESYTSTGKNQHMGIMSAELSLTEFKIQKSVLKSKIFTAYQRLSYLTAIEVNKITLSLSMQEKMPSIESLKSALSKNPELLLKEKEILKNKAMIKNAEINNYPDLNVIGAYSRRPNYNDYFTLGFGLSLPMYGTEDMKEEEQRTLILATKSLKNDISLKIDADFMSIYRQMESEYEIYHLIHDAALPQVAHMFKLTSSSISTGGDLFKYIYLLEQKLKLEQKSISAIANYNRENAKISALRGELQ